MSFIGILLLRPMKASENIIWYKSFKWEVIEGHLNSLCNAIFACMLRLYSTTRNYAAEECDKNGWKLATITNKEESEALSNLMGDLKLKLELISQILMLRLTPQWLVNCSFSYPYTLGSRYLYVQIMKCSVIDTKGSH